MDTHCLGAKSQPRLKQLLELFSQPFLTFPPVQHSQCNDCFFLAVLGLSGGTWDLLSLLQCANLFLVSVHRIAGRDKKDFLSDQCKEIEENDRMGKTKDLFKKTRDTKGKISCKDGHNKGQTWYGPNRSRRY